jgi:Spy/CpxP family protein refolding chaperone
MKGCWIGMFGTGALVISAFGQNGVGLQPPAVNTVVAIVSSDNSSRATILEPQVALSPEPGHLIQVGEPRASGLMQFQLLSTGHQLLDDQPQKETEPVSEVQVSGDTLVVSPPDSSPDVPTAIVKYLNLTPLQIAAIQAQIAVQRGQVQSLMEQLTNNRWELIATTLKGRFDIRQVRKLAAQQARILEPLVVANARLQTEIYKILTVEQQGQLDEMRKETAGLPHPSITDW